MDFATKYTRAILFFECLLHLCYKSIFLSLDTCFPIPHMLPRNRRPTFACRVQRNIVYIAVRSFVYFFTMRNLGLAWISRNFLLSRIDTRRWDLFFLVVTKITSNNTFFFHFVLQTADPTAHNRFTLFDANGRHHAIWSAPSGMRRTRHVWHGESIQPRGCEKGSGPPTQQHCIKELGDTIGTPRFRLRSRVDGKNPRA